ncbi:DUF6308 family protein [Streptomyces kebangsaanensis]|uniref:DUF6308 family protein n=1 Tax=Streptomyces kebangsaanensis TaxID=864058 RepID=A0ABW6L757_9ACTN
MLSGNRASISPGALHQVVRCLLGRPKSFWLDLHAALRADDRALHHKLLALRRSAQVPETISAPRVCDIVLWMRHHAEHRRADCSGQGHQPAGSS